jgi:hypothetical protein
MVDREVDIPSANIFFELGYNRTKGDKIKHYRRFYNNELELVEEIMPGGSPFKLEPAYRMVQKNAGLFGGDNDSFNNSSVVSGKFKGLISIYNEEKKAVKEKKIALEIVEMKLNLKEIYEV